MSILKWKVIYKTQHTLLIVIKSLNGYFFYKIIEAVGQTCVNQTLAIL